MATDPNHAPQAGTQAKPQSESHAGPQSGATTRRGFLSTLGTTGLKVGVGLGLASTGLAGMRATAGQPSSQPSGQPVPPTPAPTPSPSYFEWRELAEGVLVAMGDGGNAVLVVSREVSALIDTKLAYCSTLLRREAESKGAPIAIVINTHHHQDHTGGNVAFFGASRVYAHANARTRIDAQLDGFKQNITNGPRFVDRREGPEWDGAKAEVRAIIESLDTLDAQHWRPTHFINGARGSATIPMYSFDMQHFGPGHTDNDMVVSIPQKNILHTGDLLFHKRHPFVDANGGGSVRRWVNSLKRARSACNDRTIVVPGHGDITDVKGIDAGIAYFENSIEFVQKQIRTRATREDVIAMTVPGTEELDAPHLREVVLGAIFDELK